MDSSPSEKNKRIKVNVKVLPEGLRLKVRWGTTIMEALQEVDVRVEGDCGGLGKCGRCRVRVLSEMRPPSEEENELLGEDEIEEGIRLACRSRIEKDLVIQVEETDSERLDHQILATGTRPVFQLDPLIDERLVILDTTPQKNGLSDCERIKLALGGEYPDLEVSLHCLRTLPALLEKTSFKVTAAIHRNSLLALHEREEVGGLYGLTFDLGTSTLVGKIIRLSDGKEIAAISRLNSQSKYGADIISRIQYVKEQRHGLEELSRLIINDLNQITKQLLEVGDLKADDIFITVAAGNTTMQHLLLSLNPTDIAHAPFAPVSTDGLILRAADIGITLHPEALLYVMPSRSGYIGGDLISMILASGCAEQDDKIALGLDLGTNGEIFLGNRKRLMTCSAAAGPALEGARISHGMIAKEGAIESVYAEDGNLRYQVIGNVEPRGLCGSGLVDLVAVLLERSIIDQGGLMQPPQGGSGDTLSARVIKRDKGIYDFLVAATEESFSQKPIYFSQKDVRELQLAKGAVAAGIQILMDQMGVGIRDIDLVYVAGAFGNYIHPQSALRIGLIPKVDPKIIHAIGNAASTGASMVLLAKGYWKLANELAKSLEHVELSTRPDFNEYFIENLNFPPE
ncbi:MAG: ASKHA domain-containing protein [Syntrophobacteria bacterium]